MVWEPYINILSIPLVLRIIMLLEAIVAGSSLGVYIELFRGRKAIIIFPLSRKLANLGMKEHLVLPPPPPLPQTTQPPPALGSGEKSQSSKPYHNIYQHPPPPKSTEGLFKNGSAASRCHFCG
ncbi:hypothetical protein LXL04_037468 [Taraxacum kok-saghyz]